MTPTGSPLLTLPRIAGRGPLRRDDVVPPLLAPLLDVLQVDLGVAAFRIHWACSRGNCLRVAPGEVPAQPPGGHDVTDWAPAQPGSQGHWIPASRFQLERPQMLFSCPSVSRATPPGASCARNSEWCCYAETSFHDDLGGVCPAGVEVYSIPVTPSGTPTRAAGLRFYPALSARTAATAARACSRVFIGRNTVPFRS